MRSVEDFNAEYYCCGCKNNLPLSAFLVDSPSKLIALYGRQSLCITCENLRKILEKDPFPQKAYDTLTYHAARAYKKFGRPFAEYGWPLVPEFSSQMRHSFMHGVCPGRCGGRAFKSIPGGVGNFTVDIIYPDREPVYSTNVRFMCLPCNRLKAEKDPFIYHRSLLPHQLRLF